VQPGPADKDEQNANARPIEVWGQLVPFEQVNIYAYITGFTLEWRSDIGDRVKKGEVMAKLVAPELEQKLARNKALARKAEISVRQAKLAATVSASAAEQSKAGLEAAKAGLARFTANVTRWQAEEKRVLKLIAEGVMDRAHADEVFMQLKSSQAEEEQAKAKVKAAEVAQKKAALQREQEDISVELAQADLDIAKADVEQVHVLLQYTEVRAPFDGMVILRNVSRGDYVRPPAGAKPEPLFIMARLDRLRLKIDVPEMDAPRVVKGTEAIIRFKALPDQVFKGTVARTAWALDPEVFTLHTEIDLPNPDGKLFPGLQAKVILTPKTAKPKKN
jgi:multidrug efflux pump subunit AcrA (membrane-fusion protein)